LDRSVTPAPSRRGSWARSSRRWSSSWRCRRTLGQFSAGKRSSFASAGVATSAADIGSGTLTLVDVAAGQTTPEGEAALARAGERVDFVGFVTRYDDTPADELFLTRYVVTCCVADATIAEVRVVNVTPGAFEPNDWVEVTGAIYRSAARSS
jgi:hypothetical protein